ncbi:TPA: Cna B-type domain-containing protein [Streptococcus equi subsp. zooepidemicus]|nr:Cna B-type domain-containing protein [Streptococcus equi subsp. zooepidemicus]
MKEKLKKLISMVLIVLVVFGMVTTNFVETSVFAANDTEEYGVYDASKQRKVENKAHETVADFSLCMDYDLKSPGTSTSATFSYKKVDNVNKDIYSQYRKKVGTGNFDAVKRIFYYYLTHTNEIAYGVFQNEYYYQDTKNSAYDTTYTAYPEHNNQKALLRKAAEDSSLDTKIDESLTLTIFYYSNGGRGYQNVITGKIKSTPLPHKTIRVEGVKTWNDNNDQDGKRPTEIKVNLMKQVGDGEVTKHDTKTVTADNQGNWKYSWDDLPEYEDDKKVTYSITEDPIDDYTISINGYDVTNTHIPEKTMVEGSKIWEDNNDQAKIRPTEITINLLKNGEKVDSKIVKESDGWKWKFDNLDKYEKGKEINYTITEEKVEGYSSEVQGYNVKNIYIPSKTSIQVTKSWVDNNNQDGKRPESITIKLFANGKEIKDLTLTKENNWEGSFADLDEYENGKKIEYTIQEENVGHDYVSVITGTPKDGFTVTNTRMPEKIVVEGSKTWTDNNNQDGKRPTEITINLLKNGEKVDSKIVKELDGWKWKFDNLDKYEKGKEINYTITEEKVEGYTSKVNGYDVENSYTPEKTSVDVIKTWEDNNNQDGRRPDSITINLLKNGVKVESKILTKTDKWKWRFDNLDKYENGKEITYTVMEEKVDGYTSKIMGDAKSGYKIVNTHTTEDVPPVPKTPKPNTPENPNKPDYKKPGSMPKTGDTSNITLYAGLGILSATLLLLMYKRKREEN